MPVTIVVGGQYGSEGKGKVVALTATRSRAPWVVRCGGPNSGHTTRVNGYECVLRQLPSAIDHSEATFCIAAGGVIDEDLLVEEIKFCGLPRERVIVDANAVLLDDFDRRAEASLVGTIGSTGSGNGNALSRRLLRSQGVRLAATSDRLREFVTVQKLAPTLHDLIDQGCPVIVEGTQGFGLSLLHASGYPYVTSKDTTASAFASEVGLSPRHITSIIVVIRTFPIRVAGNSGQLEGELSWESIQSISGGYCLEPEYTSVTKKLRRVGRFDLDLVKLACRYNQPTSLAVMGLDRLDHRNRGVMDASELTDSASQFLNYLASELGVPIKLIGTGFSTHEAIELHSSLGQVPLHV
jgi:adenylosuccinate synthase